MRITRDPRFELRMVLFWVTVFAVWLFGFIFPLGNILWPKTFVSGLFAFSYVWLTFWTSSTLVTYVVGSFTSPRLLTEVDLTPESPTAIICPVKSEDVGLLLARLADTLTGNPGPHVHFWLLSDSPEEDQEAERELIRKLRRRFAKRRIFYRRRKSPAHLKQGNVREWVMRYGHRSYEFFLVLDADSVIPRGALHQLLRKAAHPDNQDVFIFQAAIRISNVASRFTRLANIGIRIAARLQFNAMWQVSNQFLSYGHNHLVRMSGWLKADPPAWRTEKSHDIYDACYGDKVGLRTAYVPDCVTMEESPRPLSASKRLRRWCEGSLRAAKLILDPDISLAQRWFVLNGAVDFVNPLIFLILLGSGSILCGSGDTAQIN